MTTTNFIPPIQNPYPVPPVITVKIEKEYAQQPLGIRVKNKDSNTVIVSGITPGSLVAASGMTVGQEILAINGIAVHTTSQAKSIIGDYKLLQFTTMDIPVEQKIVVEKENEDDSLGIKFKRADGKIIISGFTENSLAELAGLQVGQQILSINDTEILSTGDVHAIVSQQTRLEFMVLDAPPLALTPYCVLLH